MLENNGNRQTKQPKINILFLFAKLVIGGAERTLIDLVPRLDRNRFNPLVVCLKERAAFGDEMVRRGVPVIDKLAKNKFDLSVLPKLMKIVQDHQINAIYTLDHDNAMFWGRILTLLADIPVSLTVIHTTVRRDGNDTMNFLGKMFMPLTDRLIATARGSQNYLIETGIHPRKVSLIYNGVDVRNITVARKQKRLCKEDFNIPAEAKVVGIVAAFKPEKAHEVFLAGAKRILEKRDDVYFLLVGDGPQRPKIERWIAEMDLLHRVQITGFRDDMPDVFQVLDVSVLTSDPRCETFSLTILESMAAGLPAVVTDVGSMREMVFNDVNGYTIPPRQPDLFANAVLKIFSDETLLHKMSANSIKLANERFHVDRMVQETEDLISSLYHEKMNHLFQMESAYAK